MIVADASVVVEALVGPRDAVAQVEAVLRRFRPDLHAPHLLDAEVGQVLRRYVLRGELPIELAQDALEDLQRLPITRYPHVQLASRALGLHENLTFYDALYVALAEALDVPLVTFDRGLTKAPGHDAEVMLLGGS